MLAVFFSGGRRLKKYVFSSRKGHGLFSYSQERSGLETEQGAMRCVQCGHLEDKVIDSRMSKDGTTIRRRRVCLRCDYRYTTYEQIERTELRVVKRDNLREALNREKILRGLVKACEKRPVSMDRLDRAVDEIISELHRDHLREVPSSEIGKKVIEKLYAIDPVAYIRYVSVYRQFSNVEEFIQEITQMRHQTLIDPLQRKLPIL